MGEGELLDRSDTSPLEPWQDYSMVSRSATTLSLGWGGRSWGLELSVYGQCGNSAPGGSPVARLKP